MIRILLLVAALAATTACTRMGGQKGKIAPGSRGPVMEGVVNPAGLKVPASAVSAVPNVGYWNCSGNRPEHRVRCTIQ